MTSHNKKKQNVVKESTQKRMEVSDFKEVIKREREYMDIGIWRGRYKRWGKGDGEGEREREREGEGEGEGE